MLALVKAAAPAPGEHPWLARLALLDDEGEPARAGELVLPDSPFAAIAREEDAGWVDDELLERWGPEVLTAVGVLADFVLVRAEDVVLDPDDLERLDPTAPADRAAGGHPTGLLDEAPDGLAEWAEDALEALHADEPVGVPPVAAELLAVRDLDLVDDDAWPEALAALARPPYRDAVVNPVRTLLPDGSYVDLPPYTAWWLRDHPVLGALLHSDDSDLLLRYVVERLGASQRGLLEALRTGIEQGQAVGSIRAGEPTELAAMVLLITQSTVQSHRMVASLLPEAAWRRELARALNGYLAP